VSISQSLNAGSFTNLQESLLVVSSPWIDLRSVSTVTHSSRPTKTVSYTLENQLTWRPIELTRTVLCTPISFIPGIGMIFKSQNRPDLEVCFSCQVEALILIRSCVERGRAGNLLPNYFALISLISYALLVFTSHHLTMSLCIAIGFESKFSRKSGNSILHHNTRWREALRLAYFASGALRRK
jgi:hypothetical protein